MVLARANFFMGKALDQARKAYDEDEVPVGAVIVCNDAIIAVGYNQPLHHHDPTAHAEIVAMRAAAKFLGTTRLSECDLWVTLEPCAMCAGALSHARIKRLYYAASDPKGGAVEHGPRLFHHTTIMHRPEVYSGICEEESVDLLRSFFAVRR